MLSKKVWKRIGLGFAALAGIALVFTAGVALGVLKLREVLQTANRGIGKIVSERGIDEARYVTIGGIRQWVTIRGQDRDKPVLLYLHGGPGGALSDLSYSFQRPWEDEFVVVEWDQRGAGRSTVDGMKLKGTMTRERHVADTVELLQYLNKRFGKKVVVMGHSWGSLLGATVSQRRPDLVQAYMAMGQITAWEENFEESRRLLLERARAKHETELEKSMSALGPIPNGRVDLKAQDKWINSVQWEINRLGYGWHNNQEETPWALRLLSMLLVSPSMSVDDTVGFFTGKRKLPFEGGGEQLTRDLSGWHIEKDVGTQFKVPVIMVMGRYDWQVPITLARGYYGKICAPWKTFVEFPNSAHVLISEEPGRFQRVLIDDVLPAVEGKAPEGAERCASAAS
jgi:pimeloyl-ACP methyl ester carboxylesterase